MRLNFKRKVNKLAKIKAEANKVSKSPLLCKEPEPCRCEPIILGCKCGRFEWEQNQKKVKFPHQRMRKIAINPKVGDLFRISFPPDAIPDYAGISESTWKILEGGVVEVLDVVNNNSTEICWCDVTHLFNNNGNGKTVTIRYWFPTDSLIQI